MTAAAASAADAGCLRHYFQGATGGTLSVSGGMSTVLNGRPE
jgi:hypothetical protein